MPRRLRLESRPDGRRADTEGSRIRPAIRTSPATRDRNLAVTATSAASHLFDVARYEPKDFRQRRADGTWSMAGVRRVLYRLPELQNQQTAWIVEGEKDADRLASLGFPATCNPGGAGKWKPEYSQQIKAAGVGTVYVIPDNDTPGCAHADAIARSVASAGLHVRIVALPEGAKDATAWLDKGHTREDLEALAHAAPAYAPNAAALACADGTRYHSCHDCGERQTRAGAVGVVHAGSLAASSVSSAASRAKARARCCSTWRPGAVVATSGRTTDGHRSDRCCC